MRPNPWATCYSLPPEFQRRARPLAMKNALQRLASGCCALLIGCLGLPAATAQVAYTFTSVIDSTGKYSAFSNVVLYGANGSIACIATLQAGGSEIITVSNGATAVIASTTGGAFSSFVEISANSSGTVAF